LLTLLANSPTKEAVSPPPLYSSKSMGTLFTPELLRKDSQSSWGKFGASASFGVEGSTDADNDLSKSDEKYNSFNDFDRDDVIINKVETPMFSMGFIGDDFDDDDEERYLYFYVNIVYIYVYIYIDDDDDNDDGEICLCFYVYVCIYSYIFI
jgi:hypothetical protein